MEIYILKKKKESKKDYMVFLHSLCAHLSVWLQPTFMEF